jgi:hypothetical protein
VADVNSDGKLDLLIANQYSPGDVTSNVAVLLGNGDGTFQSAISTQAPTWGEWPATILVGDFNGDNKLDVATSEGYLLLGNADGSFQAPLNMGIPGAAVAVGDFNRDGHPDLILGNLAVLLNISTGFGSPTATALISSPNPSKAGQLVRFTAAVSSSSETPTGKVTFTNGTSVLATTALRVAVRVVDWGCCGNQRETRAQAEDGSPGCAADTALDVEG